MVSAYEELFTEATSANEAAARYYGIAVGVLISIFALVYWSKRLFITYFSSRNVFVRVGTRLSRPLKRAGTGTAWGGVLILPGRVALALAYLAVNAAVTFTNVDWTMQTLFAKRLGWMTLCNLCLVVLLGLKNTPLSPLAGRSHEGLNVLHRCTGYTTVLLMVLHAVIYVTGLSKVDALHVMRVSQQYAGAAAGVAMLTILVSAAGCVRKRQYELFYVVHVLMIAIILATAGFHVYAPPDISPDTLAILGLAAGLWTLDRILRASRWIYYGIGDHCTLTPLPEGATRVIMHRSITARPGSHVFLWIPAVRSLQTHPFTLVANEPAEFVIAAQDGFTQALYETALAKPGQKLRAAMEGAYGQVPNPHMYDKIVLIAGGSGATFTIALAMHWARNVRLRKHNSTLDFVWTVKSKECVNWFAEELAELRSNPAVNLRIHLTAAKRVSQGSTLTSTMVPCNTSVGIEKYDASVWFVTSRPLTLEHGRPCVDAVIGHAISTLPSDNRVLVAACGPAAMMADVRAAGSTRMIAGLPDMHLHIEEFKW